jgi:hypothetical protein
MRCDLRPPRVSANDRSVRCPKGPPHSSRPHLTIACAGPSDSPIGGQSFYVDGAQAIRRRAQLGRVSMTAEVARNARIPRSVNRGFALWGSSWRWVAGAQPGVRLTRLVDRVSVLEEPS